MVRLLQATVRTRLPSASRRPLPMTSNWPSVIVPSRGPSLCRRTAATMLASVTTMEKSRPLLRTPLQPGIYATLGPETPRVPCVTISICERERERERVREIVRNWGVKRDHVSSVLRHINTCAVLSRGCIYTSNLRYSTRSSLCK